MKVYILYYSNWEDSEVRGVYSQNAMEREKAVYAQYGREIIESLYSGQQKDLEYYTAKAKEYFKLADAYFKERTKESKKLGNQYMKQGRIMKNNAENIQNKIDKYAAFDDEQFAQYYMNKEHLSFEEYYVLQ